MKRVIVLGGRGGFGRLIAQQLAKIGIPTDVASRRLGAGLQIDANESASLRAALRSGDLVIDAAGPFHSRTPALIDAAIEIDFDVIDINDDLNYAQRVLAVKVHIESAGIRVLSSASTVSAVAAAVVKQSQITAPIRVSGILLPATRHTASVGTGLSLLRVVGQPIHVWRNGRLEAATGWREPRCFELPSFHRPLHGRLFETADSVYLPRIWQTLREVTMHVEPNVAALGPLLVLAGRASAGRRLMQRWAGLGTRFARQFGSSAGGVGYEIEAADGTIVRCALATGVNGHLTAIAPAILAARDLVEERFPVAGLVMPDQQVDPARLFQCLSDLGIPVDFVSE